MKLIRPVYLLLIFFLFFTWLVITRPDRLHNAPRPVWELRVKQSLFVAACSVLVYYSIRSASRDFRFARGSTNFRKQFDVAITSTKAADLSPISGSGPCQIRLQLRRRAKEANCDEFVICTVKDGGLETDPELLHFAFDKENHEIDVAEDGNWSIGIRFRPTKEITQPFRGKFRLQIVGRARNLSVPNAFG
jgi:hypothetical protein